MQQNKNIGGLWKKISIKGYEYLNGNITIEGKKYYISVFENNRKQNPKSPDYQIMLSDYKS